MATTPVQINKYSGAEQASYFKGRRHGTTVYYRPDGKPERIATFWYDQLNGPYYEFWPSGRLALEATYVYGLLDTQVEYSELGQRIELRKNESCILRVTQYRPQTQ